MCCSVCRCTCLAAQWMVVVCAADMYRVFHYWDKSYGETLLVDTTRERVEAVLLKDYYLYPGAEWSKLAQGTVVLVVGKAPAGNMYCVKTLGSMVCTEVGVVWMGRSGRGLGGEEWTWSGWGGVGYG